MPLPSPARHAPHVQNPVYMVFACLVADQDLLFCLYDVPCISICRAEQRPKALERLGLPNTVYREIEERGGGHVVAPLPGAGRDSGAEAAPGTEDPDRRGMDTIWTAIARQTSNKGVRFCRALAGAAHSVCACARRLCIA
jgi:hypothetical protein